MSIENGFLHFHNIFHGDFELYEKQEEDFHVAAASPLL